MLRRAAAVGLLSAFALAACRSGSPGVASEQRAPRAAESATAPVGAAPSPVAPAGAAPSPAAPAGAAPVGAAPSPAVPVGASPAAPVGAAPAGAALPPVASDFIEITTGGVRGDEKAPLVIALHGLGDSPERFVGLFDGLAAPARIVLPHSTVRYADGWAWFPFRPPPSDIGAEELGRMADSLAAFIDTLSKQRPTLGKPIVTGFSQGGALSLAIAVRHPAAVSAAFPLSGWLPPLLWPTSRSTGGPPIRAFHGTDDAMVPLERARAGASRLRELGYDIELHELAGGGHAIPPTVRAELFAGLAAACTRQGTEAAR